MRMKRISAILVLSLAIGLLGVGPALAAPAYINDVGSPCVTTTVGPTITLTAPCLTDHTLVVPNGYTLDGAGNSVTAMDPVGDHFVGAVIQAEAGTASVTV